MAENNVLSTSAQNVEIPERAELPQAATTLMPSSTAQNVDIPEEIELPQTVSTSLMQLDKQLTERVAEQSVMRERNENLSIRHVQNLDLIEVLEDGYYYNLFKLVLLLLIILLNLKAFRVFQFRFVHFLFLIFFRSYRNN